MRHIHWNDITVAGVNKVAEISGLAESPLEDFTLRNVVVTAARSGLRCANAKDVTLEGIRLPAIPSPAVEVQNVSNLEIIGLVSAPVENSPVISFKAVNDALLSECDVRQGSGVLLGLVGDANEKIVFERNRLGPDIKERSP